MRIIHGGFGAARIKSKLVAATASALRVASSVPVTVFYLSHLSLQRPQLALHQKVGKENIFHLQIRVVLGQSCLQLSLQMFFSIRGQQAIRGLSP